jgi:hypothetical protein
MEIHSDISCRPKIMASDANNGEQPPFRIFSDWSPGLYSMVSRWFTRDARLSRLRLECGKYESFSLQLLFFMGMYWNHDELIWPANEAAITELTADAILEHTQNMPFDEQELLHEDEALMIFNHVQTHRKAQISLRRVILSAFPDEHRCRSLSRISTSSGASRYYFYSSSK